jgi:hypothetical protein
MRLAVASKSRFTTLKTVEMRSFGPDSENLNDRMAALMAATAVVEFDVRLLTRVIKTACRLRDAWSTQVEKLNFRHLTPLSPSRPLWMKKKFDPLLEVAGR